MVTSTAATATLSAPTRRLRAGTVTETSVLDGACVSVPSMLGAEVSRLGAEDSMFAGGDCIGTVAESGPGGSAGSVLAMVAVVTRAALAKAEASSGADWKRSSGLFASARSKNRSTSGGRSGTVYEGGNAG